MSEVSIVGETNVFEVGPDGIRSFVVSPEEVGLARAERAAVEGGTPDRNAEIARRVLEGEAGPHRALTVINAAAALVND